MDLASRIRDIPDFPKPGILFKDISPLLADPEALGQAVRDMAEPFQKPGNTVDAVAAAEARGFIFAAPVALLLKKPLVLLRKPNKLPHTTHSVRYDLEYGQAELHMHTDALQKDQKVLLIDDVLATGGTMAAAAELVRRAGAKVAAYAFVLELSFLEGKKRLDGHPVHSLLTY